MSLIVFHCDVSSRAGLGHAMRCLALASELRTRGAQVVVAIREVRGESYDWLRMDGIDVRLLPGETTESVIRPDQFLQALAGCGVIDWLVVDHYGIDADWERAVRSRVRQILVIDDLANRPHDCDALLDQNLMDGSNPYVRLVPASATVLAGPRYALLRPEFARARAALRQRTGAVDSILICFGGADPRNHTAAAVQAVSSAAPRAKVAVVLGAANVHATSIERVCADSPNVAVHRSPSDLVELMAQADLAIGAGGTMTWERASLGLPTIAVGIAENQVAVLERMFESVCSIGVPRMFEPDAALMRDLLCVCMNSPATVRGLSRRSAALVDGLGVSRVADRLLPDEVTFRAASIADCDALREWRNHPSVRAVSLSTGEIPASAHREWLERVLADPNRILLVAEFAGQPVGVVRFDLTDSQAVISVYRLPDSKPQRIGLIRGAVNWLARNRGSVRQVVAEIRSENSASQRAFTAAGFVEDRRVMTMEIRR